LFSSINSLRISGDTVRTLSEIAKMVVYDNFDAENLNFENVKEKEESFSLPTGEILEYN
jgi:hypothetical protein